MSTEDPDRFIDHVVESVDAHAESTAFTEIHPDESMLPPGKSADEVTFGELDTLANRVANRLADLGFETGDIVSYQLPNWIEFPVLHLGVMKAGCASQPILAEHRASEVGFMVDLCDSDLVVIPAVFRGFDYVEMIAALIDDGRIDPSYVVVIGDFDHNDERFKPWSWLLDAPDDPVECPLERDDLEQVMFTSGTTGNPKGVRQTVRVGYEQTVPPTRYLGVDEADVIFAPSPLAHNTGLHYFVRTGLIAGARVVLFDAWKPEQALETLAAERCTMSVGATTFLKDLLDLPSAGSTSLPDLELFALGGSPIPQPVVEEAYEQFENITVMALWGQTENGIVTATDHDDPVERIAATDGRALSHCEVTVRSSADGEELVGEAGTLLMRGDPLMEGYHKRPGITEESFTEDGWFETGDRAVMHEDGYITIEGREDDIIIRGGENISAAEVEEHLLEHDAIKEVAVVAMPDERLQERPCAYVEIGPDHARDEVTVETLSEFLTGRGVQVHKHPERVEYLDAFPRTSTGKIQKFKLREDIAEELDMDPV